MHWTRFDRCLLMTGVLCFMLAGAVTNSATQAACDNACREVKYYRRASTNVCFKVDVKDCYGCTNDPFDRCSDGSGPGNGTCTQTGTNQMVYTNVGGCEDLCTAVKGGRVESKEGTYGEGTSTFAYFCK